MIDEHRHDTDNIGVITSGELILAAGGEETTYGPGDWYAVPPGTAHSARFEVATTEIELWFAVP